jgi:hypothetical protein
METLLHALQTAPRSDRLMMTIALGGSTLLMVIGVTMDLVGM